MRIEKDCIGKLEIPDQALYGINAERARNNFSISKERIPSSIIKSYLKIKKAAALVNRKAGSLDNQKTQLIVEACDQLLLSENFNAIIVPAIQGGAGTSTNMNINEVIANLGMEINDKRSIKKIYIHPNDDVNQSQSSNDTYPTAGKMAMLEMLNPLKNSIKKLIKELDLKGEKYKKVVKIGRTQLQEAVPTTFGRSFKAYSSLFKQDLKKILRIRKLLQVVNLGGTAIGTGINANRFYGNNIVKELNKIYNFSLKKADDLVYATQNTDIFTSFSGVLKTLAIDLSKFCNDLRLLSSGPQYGLSEINLPKKQAGSSIMPNKVNPVIPEVVNQVAFEVIGKDVTVTLAAENGQLELNAFEPIMFRDILISEKYLNNAIKTLIKNCVKDLKVKIKYCRHEVENSSITATILSPYLGYEKTTSLIKQSIIKHCPVKRLVKTQHLLSDSLINDLFSPESLANVSKTKGPANL